MVFTPVEFNFEQLALVALGSTVLWIKMGWTGTKSLLGPAVSRFVPESCPRLRAALEFVLFVVLGALVAVICTEPATGKQAIAAGLGWTGILAAEKKGRTTG